VRYSPSGATLDRINGEAFHVQTTGAILLQVKHWGVDPSWYNCMVHKELVNEVEETLDIFESAHRT
jgi:hypothetical protein